MHWTTDAAERLRALAGVLDASVTEASDGLPGSRAFRAEVRVASVDDEVRVLELLEAILSQLHAAADDRAARGTVGLYALDDGIRRGLRAARLTLPPGLQAFGSSVAVPDGWLETRFG